MLNYKHFSLVDFPKIFSPDGSFEISHCKEVTYVYSFSAILQVLLVMVMSNVNVTLLPNFRLLHSCMPLRGIPSKHVAVYATSMRSEDASSSIFTPDVIFFESKKRKCE